jgi:peptidoglycan hydrolase CwlO-like protein
LQFELQNCKKLLALRDRKIAEFEVSHKEMSRAGPLKHHIEKLESQLAQSTRDKQILECELSDLLTQLEQATSKIEFLQQQKPELSSE